MAKSKSEKETSNSVLRRKETTKVCIVTDTLVYSGDKTTRKCFETFSLKRAEQRGV